ncbi:DNA photolyase [Mameliella sp. DP3N28-2]|nr:DNA photolyase [Mameliella sediminis]
MTAAMNDAISFSPSRAAALRALDRFVPIAAEAYAARRNFDMGPGAHEAVSRLSPYIRHRIVTEKEVLRAVLARHSAEDAKSFVQEVFWRSYSKGWLEMRPLVWRLYQSRVLRDIDRLQTEAGLRERWAAACGGRTGIACFDAWARELAETGYLHNHARMWFASIWIFTLGLPWELGADFFLRHLLDGDPASNTLGWRWVAGLHTRGKHYLATPENIARFSGGRFRPEPAELNIRAEPLDGPPHPPCSPPPEGALPDPGKRTLFVLHEEDMSPGWILDNGVTPVGTAMLMASRALSPLKPAPHVMTFRAAALQEAAGRWEHQLGAALEDLRTADDIQRMAQSVDAEQIVTAHAPVGPVADVLNRVRGVPVVRMLRPYDARVWPHATAGFFKFRQNIPAFLNEVQRPDAT